MKNIGVLIGVLCISMSSCTKTELEGTTNSKSEEVSKKSTNERSNVQYEKGNSRADDGGGCLEYLTRSENLEGSSHFTCELCGGNCFSVVGSIGGSGPTQNWEFALHELNSEYDSEGGVSDFFTIGSYLDLFPGITQNMLDDILDPNNQVVRKFSNGIFVFLILDASEDPMDFDLNNVILALEVETI